MRAARRIPAAGARTGGQDQSDADRCAGEGARRLRERARRVDRLHLGDLTGAGAEQSLLGLLGTIDGYNLNPGIENPLTNQVRDVNAKLVNGVDACASLGDLTKQINDLAGKHKLTAAQAAQLQSAVGAIRANLGCDGGQL